MKDIYRSFENFENERYLLRTVTMADAPALLQVYSDKHALPFFNSDNCHGDIFYDTPWSGCKRPSIPGRIPMTTAGSSAGALWIRQPGR